MAIWVVIGHVGNFLGFYLGVNAPGWMKLPLLTSVPVNVFIALSGFVVFEMLRKRTTTYSAYIRARAARIVPIYMFALLLAALLGSFRLEVVMSQPWRSASEIAQYVQRAQAIDSNYWYHVIAHVFLVHGLVPESVLMYASQAILAPAWSLSLEWQFYLIAPAIFLVVANKWWGLLAIAAMFGVLQGLAALLIPSLTNAAIVNSWGYFFLGWACSRLLAVSGEENSAQKVAILVLFAAPLALISVFYADADPRVAALSLAIWFVAFIGACWPLERSRIICYFQRVVNGLLSMDWLRKIGESSYSLYLLHVLVLDIIGWLLLRAGYLRGNEVSNFLLLLVAVLPPSILVAMLGYKFIELPFMALGRGAVTKRLHRV